MNIQRTSVIRGIAYKYYEWQIFAHFLDAKTHKDILWTILLFNIGRGIGQDLRNVRILHHGQTVIHVPSDDEMPTSGVQS